MPSLDDVDALAAELSAVETGIRDPGVTADELDALGRRQQLAYRMVNRRPEWHVAMQGLPDTVPWDQFAPLLARHPTEPTLLLFESHGQDSYGRQLGRLWVNDQDVGAQMVSSGWAWAYSYRTGRGPYAALQRDAERGRRGLFAAHQTAMSPALFRQFHGSCHGEDKPTVQAPVQRVPQTGQPGSR